MWNGYRSSAKWLLEWFSWLGYYSNYANAGRDLVLGSEVAALPPLRCEEVAMRYVVAMVFAIIVAGLATVFLSSHVADWVVVAPALR